MGFLDGIGDFFGSVGSAIGGAASSVGDAAFWVADQATLGLLPGGTRPEHSIVGSVLYPIGDTVVQGVGAPVAHLFGNTNTLADYQAGHAAVVAGTANYTQGWQAVSDWSANAVPSFIHNVNNSVVKPLARIPGDALGEMLKQPAFLLVAALAVYLLFFQNPGNSRVGKFGGA
ncbi:MAG TPA: hypothetical protein VHI93_01430 [Candidatus Thermoplasmatota archaeon]|nr:hypothetical protein [Candidatus Thermoplasmatota archaeon]